MTNIPELSFFITRKIKNINDNFIWIECVKQIRNFYKFEPIFIIDDCNNPELIVKLEDVKDLPVFNIHFINTDEDLEIKGRGEFASFYYYRKLKVSSRALFIQDSFFLLKPLDNNIICDCDIRFLFGFIDKEEKFKSILNNLILDLNEGDKIIEYKYKYNWIGCFGVSCLISLEYLLYLEKKYNFFIISNDIINKTMKEVFERLFGLLITYDKKNFSNITIYGVNGNYNYDLNYYIQKKNEMIANNIPYFNYHQHQL
jgi:hypothetical protein